MDDVGKNSSFMVKKAEESKTIEAFLRILERAVRYAIDRSKTLVSLQKSEQQLHLLSAKLLEAQESERKILARELHDSLGSSLTAIRYALEQNLIIMSRGEEVPHEISLEQIIEMVKDTIQESHRITSHLRPSVLDDLGLLPALRAIGRELHQLCSNIRIDIQLEVNEEEIPESLKIVIYRIVQEALNNTSKYSDADTVLLKLENTGEGIELIIKDNGCGFDSEAEVSHHTFKSGMGLVGMKERAVLSNGILKIWSEKGKGTVIRGYWPIIEG